MSRTKQEIINSITSSVYPNENAEITGGGLQDVLTGMVTDLADQNTVDELTQSVSELSDSVSNIDDVVDSISTWIETTGSQGGGASVDGYTYKGVASTSSTVTTGSSSVFYVASTPGTYTGFLNSSSEYLSVGDNEVAFFKRTGNNVWHKDSTGAASKTVVDQLTESVANINNWISEHPGGGGGSGSIDGYAYKTVVPSLSFNPSTASNIFYIASIPGTYSNFLDSNNLPLEVGDNEVAILKNDGMKWVKDSTGAIRTASGGGGSSVDTLTTAKLYNYHPGQYMTWKGTSSIQSSSEVYFETDNVTKLSSSAYQGNTTIKGISRYPLEPLGTNNLSYCFEGCTNMKFVPYFVTSGTVDMSHMFESCSKLVDVDHPYDTSNVTTASYMFAGCNDLKTVHLGSLFTGAALGGINMSHMFENCYSLNDFSVSDMYRKIDTSYMFANCYSLVRAPLLHSSTTTSMTGCEVQTAHMFENCYSLNDLSNLAHTSSVFYHAATKMEDISYMFTSCSTLDTLPAMHLGYTTASEHIFDGCYHLRNVEGLVGLKSSVDLSSTEQLTDRSVKNIFSSVGSVSVVDDRSKPTLRLSDQTWLDHVGTALDRFDKAQAATVTLLNKNWRLENSAGGFVGPVTTISNWDDIHIPSGATSSTIPVSGNN